VAEESFRESSNNPLRVVELLGANPFITTKGVAGKLGVAFTTPQRAIGLGATIQAIRYTLIQDPYSAR
jgi:hypothetical protein